MLAGDLLRAVGAAVVGDQHLTAHTTALKVPLRLVDADRKSLRLIEAGHQNGELGLRSWNHRWRGLPVARVASSIVQNRGIVKLGLVVTTLGRLDRLRELLESLRGQLTADDRLVIVAQQQLDAVELLAAGFRAPDFRIQVTTSAPGASRGRNAGVEALGADAGRLLHFPNDTTWFPTGAVERMRLLPDDFTTGALTITDEHGPKFVLPEPGTPLDRWNAWTVIEMGLLIRQDLFQSLGGFNPDLGTGAATPWQAGEVTDLLLRLIRDGHSDGFAWQPATLHLGGIADAHGLSTTERRRKLRGYGRGLGRLVATWRYPLWWRIAFTGGGLFFGLRHPATNTPLDGWWVMLGRLEGTLGRTFGDAGRAVTR